MTGAALSGLVRAAGATCFGDCSGDGAVTIDEVLQGVNIALGTGNLGNCMSIDRDANLEVTVDELLVAVNAALIGCPPESTPTATMTATEAVNQLPVLTPIPVYRTYVGAPVQLSIPVADPDGDPLTCTLTAPPAGAKIEGQPPFLAWTPRPDQIGPFYVPFGCADRAVSPAVALGTLVFKVSPLDGCAIPVCDPATGCVSSLPPVDTSCCSRGAVARVAEPLAGCPEGRVIFAGGNASSGFGRLQNCDRLRVLNAAQFSAEVRLHVEGRCISSDARPLLHARLETMHRVVFDKQYRIPFTQRGDGYSQILAMSFNVEGDRPYFDLQDAEANLTIKLTDADDAQASQSLRLILTFTPVPELPDLDVPPTPSPTGTLTP